MKEDIENLQKIIKEESKRISKMLEEADAPALEPSDENFKEEKKENKLQVKLSGVMAQFKKSVDAGLDKITSHDHILEQRVLLKKAIEYLNKKIADLQSYTGNNSSNPA